MAVVEIFYFEIRFAVYFTPLRKSGIGEISDLKRKQRRELFVRNSSGTNERPARFDRIENRFAVFSRSYTRVNYDIGFADIFGLGKNSFCTFQYEFGKTCRRNRLT